MIRVEVRDALKTALITALNDTTVGVRKGWDATESKTDQLWIGGSRGAFEYEVFAKDAMPHEDQFTIDVLVLAGKPNQTQSVAEARAQVFMNAVVEALNDPTFSGLSVIDARSSSFLVQALLSGAEGPHTEPREEGYIGFGSVEISVHTRTRYL